MSGGTVRSQQQISTSSQDSMTSQVHVLLVACTASSFVQAQHFGCLYLLCCAAVLHITKVLHENMLVDCYYNFCMKHAAAAAVLCCPCLGLLLCCPCLGFDMGCDDNTQVLTLNPVTLPYSCTACLESQFESSSCDTLNLPYSMTLQSDREEHLRNSNNTVAPSGLVP